MLTVPLAGLALSPHPPRIETATCLLPVHTCERLRSRAYQGNFIACITHVHADHAQVRVVVVRPWELDRGGHRHAWGCFETSAATGLLTTGSRATISAGLLEFRLVPATAAPAFVAALVGGLSFARMPL